MVVAIALFGAFGTVALALALAPGGQQSATHANASQGPVSQEPVSQTPVVVSRIEVPAPPTTEARAVAAIAAVPPRAAKSDRLVVTPRAALSRAPVKVDLSTDPQPLDVPVRSRAGEREVAMSTDAAVIATGAPAAQTELDPDEERNLEFGLSDPQPAPPPPGSMDAGAADDVGEKAVMEEIEPAGAGEPQPADAQAVDDADSKAVEEAVEEAVKVAIPEPAATTRAASVNSDVNMRAKPDNSGAVILVVPRNSEVDLIGCDYWCEVVYKGKRGFIYKGFVRGANS